MTVVCTRRDGYADTPAEELGEPRARTLACLVILAKSQGGLVIRVYADLVADLFHHGHMLFLQRASALGDYLIVGIHAEDVAMS